MSSLGNSGPADRCPPSAESDLNQLTPQSDGNGVRAIVSTRFVHQVPDVKINRSFGDRQPAGDLLVAIAVANEAEHI